MPTSEDIKIISDKWRDICKDTKNIQLLIALERSTIREDEGALVLLFDDTDKIMIDILSGEETKAALIELIEKHTGFTPKIITRLASYYEDEVFTEDDDPLNLIEGETVEAVPEVIATNETIPTPAPSFKESVNEDEEEEEYDFEEEDRDEEEF